MKKRSLLLFTAIALLGIGGSALASCGADNSEDLPPVEQKQVITLEGPTNVKLSDEVTYVAKSNGEVLSGVTFKSSDKKVAIIDSATGELTPLKPGSTRISATLEGYESAALDITIIDDSLKTMTITAEKTTIKVGETLQFTSSEEGVEWSSTNTNVATVGKTNGLVKGQGEGTSTITATKEGFNPATFNLTVEKADISEPVVQTHTITYTKVPGLTWNSTISSAKAGDTVSFTITLDEGISIVSVKYNSTEITPVDETYSFVMPDSDVIISAQVTAQSDISIGGDISAALILDDDGIYKALGIDILKDSSLYYLAKNEKTGEFEKLNFQNFNFNKCFARIHSAGDYKNYQFDIAGGFTYDFFYDPSDATRPCYVQRTKVLKLPEGSQIDAFENLFDSGSVSPSTYPANVKAVHYTNTKSSEKYDWTKYKDNKSYALVKELYKDTKKAEVYKSIDDSVLTIVDTYVESKNDTTKKDDNTQFSAKYNVVDVESEHNKFEYLTKDAIVEANSYSHNYYSLEFDIMYAYRVGFGADEGYYTLKSSKRNFESVATPSGGFTTTLTASKTYDDSNNNYKYHFEYEVIIDFRADGSINSGTYVEKRYNEDDYDFANDKFKTGGKDRGTSIKELTFAYEYGTDLENAPEFDESPYFIKEITNVRINNDSVNKDTTKNVLKKNDWIEKTRGTLKYDYAPETALDDWQYDVISSSNTNVVDHSNSYYTYEAVGFGTSDVVIGNHSTNAVTSEPVTVTVPTDGVELRYPYWNSVWGQTSKYNVIDNTADDVYVYAGIKSYIGLYTSPQGADNTNFTFTVSHPDLVSISYDPKTYLCTIDATGAASITESVKVTLTVNWPSGSKNLGIYLIPMNSVSEEKLIGTWTYEGDNYSPAGTMTLTTDSTYNYSGTSYNLGTITRETFTLKFGWTVDETKNIVIKGNTLTDTKGSDWEVEYLNLDYDAENDKLGVSLTLGSWEGFELVSDKSIFGDYYDDGEGYTEEYFTDFSRKN